MRITFVLAQADLSGGVRMVAGYARRLAARGHKVVVVSRPPRSATVREKLRSALKRRPLPMAARGGPSHFDAIAVEHRVLDSHRPITAADVPDADVVIATWWETARWVAAFAPSKGAAAYFIQGYETREDLPPEVLDATWRLPMHKIVIARWLARLAEERFGDVDYSLVPNAVDLDQFSVPARGKQPTPTVGMVYTHVAAKGCDLALQAFDRASKQINGLKLIAFGSRPPTPDLPLPGGAEFVLRPAQDKIRDIYARTDAWLFASRQEGFGLPLLEAMACRTPVIATPAGAAPELLAEGGGIQVPPENAAAFADAIIAVARMNGHNWSVLSNKAHATACRYNWEQATTLFEAALQRAVEKSANSPFASM
jgi:glycosyltransferase involved in cell wall biosynthesis